MKSKLTIILALLSLTTSLAFDRSALITWWANPPEENIKGYYAMWSTVSNSWPNTNYVGNTTNVVISGLVGGKTYYFAVQAENTNGFRSDLSIPISLFIPPATPHHLLIVLQQTDALGSSNWLNLGGITIEQYLGTNFYRLVIP